MAKNKGMDNLANDAARALAAGMSYGKWKHFHPHTKGEEIVVVDPNTKPCVICGKPMKKGGTLKKYCSPECAYEARKLREIEFKQRKMAKKKEEA